MQRGTAKLLGCSAQHRAPQADRWIQLVIELSLTQAASTLGSSRSSVSYRILPCFVSSMRTRTRSWNSLMSSGEGTHRILAIMMVPMGSTYSCWLSMFPPGGIGIVPEVCPDHQCGSRGSSMRGCPCPGPHPRPNAEAINHEAEHIGRNQTELRGLQPDRANDQAVNSGHHKAGPLFPPNKNGRCNC